MSAPETKRNMRSIIAAIRLRMARQEPKAEELDPVTAAIHARLDASTERLDAALHRLKRRLSSKSERSHLAVVPKG